ncbi:MAG: divergent polysaccharide deacetylase family protein [Candidatus Latescibacteria bacterium]|jgi:hypothetical protein|nr:divergent polysaccharide deacetylase family protein [Candidatus Latescibacterota bacterium]
MARKRRDLTAPAWALACVLVLLSAGLALWVWQPDHGYPPEEEKPSEEPQWEVGPEGLRAFADSAAVRATHALISLGVPRYEVELYRLAENRASAMRWEVRSGVPGALPLAVCNLELTRLARRLAGEVIEAREDLSGSSLSMLLGLRGERTVLVTLRRKPDLARTTGRIAIIVDDFGHQDPALISGFCSLKQPVTLSVFPWHENAIRIAEQAAAAGHGVMVHLPMEPIDYPNRDPGPDAIFEGDSEERIRMLTRKALTAVPHARGMNNHMGSRVTESREAIREVLREVRSLGFFYIDSMTSPRSVAYQVAQEMGVASRRNAAFLDLRENERAVGAELKALAVRARLEGTAVAIGHAKETTLAVLERELPELAAEGFVFVKVEEAVR